ncbi:hypothetical protein [Diaphorobacter nitroreducens]
MQTHDFFTRIVALNCMGPNMETGSGERNAEPPKKVYICGICDSAHDSHYKAENCCPTEIYTEYECQVCRVSYGALKDAEACCTGKPVIQPKQCPVCMGGADSYQDAADCCLHTHPTMTALGRERVANDVERGTSWPDAIRAHAFH